MEFLEIGVSFVMHNEALQITPEFMLMSDVGWGPRTAPEKLVTRKTK